MLESQKCSRIGGLYYFLKQLTYKREKLAASYSRAGYTSTTIGNAAFDGRVRDGIGSDHSFMATKKLSRMISDTGFAGTAIDC